jgi:hypothetical protein
MIYVRFGPSPASNPIKYSGCVSARSIMFLLNPYLRASLKYTIELQFIVAFSYFHQV